MFRPFFTAATLAALVASNLLAAQDPSQKDREEQTLEDAIERATIRIRERVNVVGTDKALETIPGAAYALEGEELERQKHGLDDIHHMLRQVPGIVIQEEEGYGLRPNIGMRGSGSERSAKITLMEDGVLIAPAPYTAPAAYYFPVTGRMESIEIRKGSSQIKFGPRTNGGALNLVSTRVPASLALSADLAFGQDRTGKAHVYLGDSYSNVGWLFETYQLRTNGFKELDGGDSTGFYVQDYVGKLRFNTSPSSHIFQSFELKIGAGAESSDETYLGLTDEDFAANPVRRYAASQPDNIQWDHQQFQAQHFLAVPNGIDVTTTVYRNNFARNWYKLQSILGTGIASIFNDSDDSEGHAHELAVAKGDSSNLDDLKVRANNREYYSQGVQTVAGFSAAAHRFELGFRYHEDEEDRFQHEDGYQMIDGRMNLTSSGAPGSQTNRVSDARAFALFAQDQIEFSRWTFVPGIRYESIDMTRTDYDKADPNRTDPLRVRDNHVTAIIPGAGLTYRVSPRINLFGGIHKGFSPPGPGADAFTESEESVNYELGFRGKRETLTSELVFFYNDYSNLLGADTLSSGGEGEGNLFNGGASRSMGLEAALGYDFAELIPGRYRFPTRLSYSLTDAVFLTSFESTYAPWGEVQAGDALPYLPRHQLYASFAIEDDGWIFGVDANYGAHMRTVAGRGPIPKGQGTDAYFVVNVFGELDIAKDLRVFASVQNLTNNAYIVARRPAGARPGLPRTVMAGIKLRLGS